MEKLKTKVILVEHNAKMAMMKLAAKLGIKKYEELTEGLSRDMTNTRCTKRFHRLYGEAEERAVRKWMKNGNGKTYLDVGAGSGIFSKIAREMGASQVVAVDINENCLAMLRKKGFDAREMDAKDMSEFTDGSFDRVMIFGNTLGGMYEDKPDVDKSFQVQVLKEMLRIAKEEVCITVQKPESFRLMLQYYRMNGLEVYGYNDETGVRQVKMKKPGRIIEYRAQHFRKEQIEKLLSEAGVPAVQYTIEPINKINWIVIIKKANEREQADAPTANI